MDAISEILTRGVENVYPSKQALEKVLRSGKKLRLYQGFDPTGTQLHIGHMVGLRKLRQWQDLGHHVIFLIGDGTGQAGDPSGRSNARNKFLKREELRKNAKDYVMQAKKVVRFDGENPVEILYNGDWLNKLGLVELLDLFERVSLQQLTERDIFEKRMKEGKPVILREAIYPLLQGYDSVAMKVDLEIGGSDQTFNMLTGRQLVKEILGKEKFVMTMPLLADSSGNKIGKSEGNVIALTASPNELFGMIMNLPDEVIVKCFEYITDIPMTEVVLIRDKIAHTDNPMIYKKRLAFTIVAMLNTQDDAQKAQVYFENTFQKNVLPGNIPSIFIDGKSSMNLVELLVTAKLASSNSEAKRLILGRAVEIEGQTITDSKNCIQIKDGMTVRVGKHRFIKLNIK